MRKFTIRSGKFVGEHTVYDSIAEAEDNGIKDIKSPWWNPKTAVGDWVQSDDGYVVQCLNRSYLRNKRHRSGQYTDLFRFPQGTFGVYYDKRGEPRVQNFYGVSSSSHKNSVGGASKTGKFMTTRKREFVVLMEMGYDAYSACVKAFKMYNSTSNQISMRVNKLLTDPLIKESLMEAMKPFMEQVSSKVKEITGYDNLTQLAVDNVAELITMDTKGIKEKSMKVKFLLDTFGEPLGLVAPSNKQSKKEIEEARYEVIQPPRLGNQQ